MPHTAAVADIQPVRRKAVLLRLDLALYNALARWAADDFRSTNAQIEFLLRQVATDAGRIRSAPIRRRHMRSPGA